MISQINKESETQGVTNMATLDEAIAKGHERYFKNSYWKGIYDNAPDDAKAYYDLSFSRLDGGTSTENDSEYRGRMEEVYKALSEAGWKYLIDHTENNMGKWGLRKAKGKYAAQKTAEES